MFTTIDQINLPIQKEITIFEKTFNASIISNMPFLNQITQFIINKKGKRIRPIFIFLTAKMLGVINKKTYRAAYLIELIHIATLIHDDVIDQSDMRRGFFSINAVWKNKVAILVGDYLLSKSIMMCTKNKDFDLLHVIAYTIKEMTEGELLQLEMSKKLNINEKIYYTIIQKKTASLLSACCKSAGYSINLNSVIIKQLHKFGQLAGIAFQIKDDLLDYTNNNKTIGKPIGIDIKEKKITLPLIYVLNTTDAISKKWLIDLIQNHNKNQKKIYQIVEFVKNNGGLEYAIKKMIKFKNQALLLLEQFPNSESKQSLKLMLNYIIERKK